jgi:tripartite ATP-independent transporter DctP family solute receptor
MKKVILGITVSALMLVSFIACSGASSSSSGNASTEATAAVKLIATHVQTVPDAAFTVSMHLFADKVKEISGGKIEIEVHDGTLGTNETELIDKLVIGAVDITVASPGFMSKLGVQEVDMFSLPYLIESTDHFKKVFSGEVGKDFADIVYKKTNEDFKVLGFWSAGIRNYYGKKPVNTPADLKGIKIRTQNAPVQLEFWEKCGAIPTNVAFAELYQALQQGVIDAAENDYLTLQQNEHHKTNSKFVSETGHDISPRLFMIKGDSWKKLNQEQQNLIQTVAAEATAYNIQYNIDKAGQSKQKIITDGGIVNTVKIAPFVTIAVEIQDKFAVKQGFEEWLKRIRSAR